VYLLFHTEVNLPAKSKGKDQSAENGYKMLVFLPNNQ